MAERNNKQSTLLVPTVYYLPFTIYWIMSTVYCLLYTVYCLLPTAHCWLYYVFSLQGSFNFSISTMYCQMNTVYCLMSIAYGMQHHKISQMSPQLLWYLMMPLMKSFVGIILASSDPKPGIMRDKTFVFGHHFVIMRSKSRHHQRPELLWFWQIWSLMMPDFGKSF